MRHVERAVHHDVGDGVETLRREVLGARDEVAGRVVDEPGEWTGTEDVLDHLIDGRGVADIDAVTCDLPAGLVGEFEGGRIAHGFAAAADEHLGAKLEKLRRHFLAETGAATGHQNALRLEEALLEHGAAPVTGPRSPRSRTARRAARAPERQPR